MNTENGNEVRLIRRVTWVGFWVNAALMALKIVFGIIGRSDALVADGVHSLSDFATDLIVLIFVGIAYKSADTGHPYGHGKYETFASLLIAVSLIAVAIGIGIEGAQSIVGSMKGAIIPRPGAYTLAVILLSIGLKEMLYHYTMRVGRHIGSGALQANAWHHRSDAFSSVATLVGVGAALFLGEKWRILDPVASVLIAVFIAISAVKIARPSWQELLEKSLPDSQVKKAKQIIANVPGVKAFHRLRTRRNGHSLIFDTHVKVDPQITVTAGHNIATDVENALRKEFGNNIITNIHIEPY